MYLWRQTHDPIYREWGWEVVMVSGRGGGGCGWGGWNRRQMPLRSRSHKAQAPRGRSSQVDIWLKFRVQRAKVVVAEPAGPSWASQTRTLRRGFSGVQSWGPGAGAGRRRGRKAGQQPQGAQSTCGGRFRPSSPSQSFRFLPSNRSSCQQLTSRLSPEPAQPHATPTPLWALPRTSLTPPAPNYLQGDLMRTAG